MKIVCLILTAMLYLGISPAMAQHEVGNGGDRIRLGFIREGKEILSRIEKSQKAMELLQNSHVTSGDLESALTIYMIRVTKDRLTDNAGSVVDAVYKNGQIWLNDQSWLELMKSNTVLDQLILHEMLRAVHFNDDDYVLSAEVMPLLPPQRKATQTILTRATRGKQEREKRARQAQQQQQQTPPEKSDPFSFHAAASAYENAKSPKSSQLPGVWKLIGITELSNFPDITISSLNEKESTLANSLYRARGISVTGNDGLKHSPLALALTAESLFDGSESISATLQQGPNATSINESGLVFSQWSYQSYLSASEDKMIDQNSYYHYACRITKRDQLICEIKFEVAHAESVSPKFLPFAGRTVFYVIYSK